MKQSLLGQLADLHDVGICLLLGLVPSLACLPPLPYARAHQGGGRGAEREATGNEKAYFACVKHWPWGRCAYVAKYLH